MSEEECKLKAALWFPKGKYEIEDVYAGAEACVVDFRRKGFEAQVDCGGSCDTIATMFREQEDDEKTDEDVDKKYNECMDDCKAAKKSAERGSVSFRFDGSLTSAVIPGNCEFHWYDPDAEMFGGEEEGDFEKSRERLIKEFSKMGCDFDSTHIHPHEVMRELWEEVMPEPEMEEFPAVCYYHAVGAKCKIRDVLKVVEGRL